MLMIQHFSRLAPRMVLVCLLYCLPSTLALAESQLEFEEPETETADDENVEDIESSRPCEKKATTL